MKCHKVTAAIIEQDDDDEAEEFDQQGDAQIDQNIPVFTDEVVSPFVEEWKWITFEKRCQKHEGFIVITFTILFSVQFFE